MTFKSLLNFGGIPEKSPTYAMDRYHHTYYDQDHDRYSSKGKGSGGNANNGAALSALTLLAFLFLLNVMQQSLVENNTTVTTTATTIFLRNIEEQPISLTSRLNNEEHFEDDKIENNKKKISYIKIKNSLD